MKFSRRDFLRTAVRSSALALLQGATGWPLRALFAQTTCQLPDPQQSGIEHIVVVMMENRSFDHLFGWMPNADGKQAGLIYNDSLGLPHQTPLRRSDCCLLAVSRPATSSLQNLRR